MKTAAPIAIPIINPAMESIGVSSTQLGSLLSSACQDALNYANQLP